jgi:quercetin dioxygenase-like cupin family protein
MGFNVVYTTSEFPPSLNNKKDLATHDQLLASGKLGLVNPHGTVCRMVDFAPGNEPIMHRTQSLDYGIVLEGEIEMELDSGEKRLLKRGDVAVQRATMHAWRNASKTEWCRMIFVLQDCQPLVIGGQKFGEDLSGAGEIPPSGNDA